MTSHAKLKYSETDRFRKDFKRLLKKYRTLEEDLESAKRYAIELYHCSDLDNQSIFPVEGCCSGSILICKLKKFTCKTLKGRGAMSGIRVIYAFHVETREVVFIEMYFKADQENEDRERITAYLCERND